ncbi:MAG: UDP-N-acetylglucosamine 1-carboxyvinyltransferase [Patescibacteria group bacterium]
MEQFLIHGAKPLRGTIDVKGAKNAAFPILAATILTKENCIIENLPLIEDVFRIIEILESMQAKVDWISERAVKINTKNLNPAKIDKKLVGKLRGSVLLLGPLLARFHSVKLPRPGGDIIGARPIDTHLSAFAQLGIKVILRNGSVTLQQPKSLQKSETILDEFSVTATENIMLFAAAQQKPVIIKNADQDYPIQELADMLSKMGARVDLKSCHVIEILGKKTLKGVRHTLIYDPIEAGTFMVLAAAAKANVLVRNVEIRFLEFFLKKLKDFGVILEIRERKKGFGDVRIKPFKTLRIDKIQCFIYPGIHTDLQSPLGVLATQAKGPTLLHDPLYPGRLKYLEELNKMGAEIYVADPHRAIINGPTRLHGTDLGTFDLRGGAALLIAALIARGKSTISNIYQVDRGYEKIEERLQKLGADIKRVNVK